MFSQDSRAGILATLVTTFTKPKTRAISAASGREAGEGIRISQKPNNNNSSSTYTMLSSSSNTTNHWNNNNNHTEYSEHR